MNLHLDGAVAIVTGAASGIGRMTGEYLRRDGARLVLADSNADTLESARGERVATRASVLSLSWLYATAMSRCRTRESQALWKIRWQ